MNQKFDVNGAYKYPTLKLCKPNRKGQGFITGFYNLKVKKYFNRYNEMSFDINWLYNGSENKLYKRIIGKKIIYAGAELGYWFVKNIDITGNGISETKTVTCVSAEIELAKNKLNRVEKTIKLYNPINALDESTLLGFFIKCNPKWSIGTVDGALWEKARTFDVQTTDWYNFLINDVEEKFMCIFKFDNITRTLHCHTVEGATKKTNIYLSFDNLIDSIEIEEKSDEVYTALDCNGANNLDIRSVNPLGSNLVYNFEYFKKSDFDWMSRELIDSLNLWESKIAAIQPDYTILLTKIREVQVELTRNETNLVEEKNSLEAAQQAMSLALVGEDNVGYNINVAKRNECLRVMAEIESAITKAKSELEGLKAQMVSINDSLSFENNFTAEEISYIDDYTIVDSYQNDGFKRRDNMTGYEIQDESQQLYDHSLAILDKVSSPKYYFKCKLLNFIFLKEYNKFTSQADTGSIITCEIEKNWRTPMVLLSMEISYDQPDNLTVEFSNRHRLDNGIFEFNDLFTQNSYSSSSYDWDKALISDPVKSGLTHEVKDFMNGIMEAAKNSLVSAKGIGVSIDGSGIHGRRYIEEVLQATELWITNDMIGMSDDNFNTLPKVALGRFKLPNSENYVYGMNAQFLAGLLVVGNQFIFEAENGSFKFDGTGAQLYNAIFEIVGLGNMRRILMDAENGFKIQGRANPNDPWEDKIFLEKDGNANFKGTIICADGEIGGWIIKPDGLYSPFGDFIKNDGTGKLSLYEWNRNTARFDGTIIADNLIGLVPQTVTKLSAERVNYLPIGAGHQLRLFPGSIRFGKNSFITEDNNALTLGSTQNRLELGTKYQVNENNQDDNPTFMVVGAPYITLENDIVKFNKPTSDVWTGTQAEYDALSNKNSIKLAVIKS